MNTAFDRPIIGLLILALLVSACGGGGGSSGGSGSSGGGIPPITEPAAPVVSYNGNQQDATIDQTNAAQFAYRVFLLRELTQLLETFWVDAPQGAIDSSATEIGQFGGSVALRTQINSAGNGYVEAMFSEFANDPSNPTTTINGRYVQRFRPVNGTIPGTDFSFAGPGNLEFDDLTFEQDGELIRFHGVLRISGVDSNQFSVNMIVSNDASADQYFYENCTIRFSDEPVGSSVVPAVELAGAVYEFDEGRVGFSPLGPTPQLGYQETAGYLVGGAGGGVSLSADGPTTQVRPISFAFVSIVMDVDNDGFAEAARRFSWPALAGEIVPETSVMTGPIANAGNNRTPAADAPVNVHALFSHDDDSDWLSFEWNILAKPPQSALSVESLRNAPFLELVLDVPGDYVLELQATDGISSSRTAVTLRHAPAEFTTDISNAPTGGLEIGLPVDLSAPILIDGHTAHSWPYDNNLARWSVTGTGISTLSPTGDNASTFFSTDSSGHYAVRMSANSPLAGAPSSDAEVNLSPGPDTFETAIELVSDENAFDMRKSDFDGDSDDDLIFRVGTGDAARILIYLDGPDGLAPWLDTPAGSGHIAIGDLNLDGLPDIVSAAEDGLLVFTQLPDHTLAEPDLLEFPASGCGAAASRSIAMAIADIHGDDRNDIVAIHPCEDALVVWPGNASGNMGAPVSSSYANHFLKTLTAGDINGDGRDDIALTMNATSTAFPEGVSVLLSQGDGSFAESFFLLQTSLRPPGVAIGDVDGDDRADLVALMPQEVRVYYQNADGSLTETTVWTDTQGGGLPDGRIAIVDLDGLNGSDLFLCERDRRMQLLVQQPGGAFDLTTGPGCTNDGIDNANPVLDFDINGDDKTDLVTLTENHRGVIDERALVTVFLRDVHTYPIPGP